MGATNPQDKVRYMRIGDNLGPVTVSNPATSGTITVTNPNLVNNQSLSQYQWQWPYGYGYGTDTEARTRIATLEGQVKALSAMVAALISGRASAKPTPRKRAK